MQIASGYSIINPACRQNRSPIRSTAMTLPERPTVQSPDVKINGIGRGPRWAPEADS
jgi:hypothetical protein